MVMVLHGRRHCIKNCVSLLEKAAALIVSFFCMHRSSRRCEMEFEILIKLLSTLIEMHVVGFFRFVWRVIYAELLLKCTAAMTVTAAAGTPGERKVYSDEKQMHET